MRTHCFRCKNPLEFGRDHSWCIPCLKAYKKTFNKGRKVIPSKEYVLNEQGIKIKLIPELSSSDYNRFWSKATLTANPEKCWNWNANYQRGHDGKKPYGQFSVNGGFFKAHRIAYFLQTKKDPRELCVLHKCDNHKCVNPNHLFLGTNNDNVQDKKMKGRHRGFKKKANPYNSTLRGINHPMAKLNEEKVTEIRTLYANGGTTSIKLAEKYQVSKKTVLEIIHKRIWTHV